MGLDMYLGAKIYFSKYDEADADTLRNLRQTPGLPDGFMNSHITLEATVAQWRKANQIHKWFVGRCQGGHDDCQTSYVSRDDITDLIMLCKNVLANKELGESYASQYLPTESGFFFGGTAYDQYYYQDLEDTIKMLQPLLGDEYQKCSFTYHASW